VGMAALARPRHLIADQSSPVATGSPGVFDHALQEPGYTVTSRPALVPASASCAAVMPDPQYAAIGVLPSAPASSNAAAISAADRKRPSAVSIRPMGRLRAPGMWPGIGSIGSVSPRYRSPALASSSTPVCGQDAAPSVSMVPVSPGEESTTSPS